MGFFYSSFFHQSCPLLGIFVYLFTFSNKPKLYPNLDSIGDILSIFLSNIYLIINMTKKLQTQNNIKNKSLENHPQMFSFWNLYWNWRMDHLANLIEIKSPLKNCFSSYLALRRSCEKKDYPRNSSILHSALQFLVKLIFKIALVLHPSGSIFSKTPQWFLVFLGVLCYGLWLFSQVSVIW